MAFLPQGQQGQNQQGTDPQNQIPQIPLIPTLQGSGGGSAGQGSGTSTSPGGAPSTPWSNVSSYLAANAGQAGSVADVLAGRLTNQYNTAQQGIQNAQQNFGQQIEGARVPYNAQIAQQASQSPSDFVKDPSNLAAFQKMYNANYTGPQDFSTSSDYSDLQAKVQGAQKQAALVNQGTPGIMTLLQQAEAANGRNPTQGVTALDSLLLQESPANFSKISAAAQPFAGLTGMLGGAQTTLDTAAQQAAQEAAATKSNLQNQFIGPNGVVPTLQAGINQGMQDASKKVTDYNKTIAGIIADLNQGKPLSNFYPDYIGSNVDPSGVLAALNPYGGGGTAFTSAKAQGWVNPGYLTQFYDAPALLDQPGVANVMTPQQLADAQAINQMLGSEVMGGLPQTLGKQYEIPQGFGGFRGQEALNSLYDTLDSMQGILPNLSADQQNAWLGDITQLAQWLGRDTTYQGPSAPPPPTPPPTPEEIPPDPLHPIQGPGGGWLGFV